MRKTILPTHPTIIDPRTGLPLVALGVGRNGRPWWPIMGGNGEGDPQPATPVTPVPPAAPAPPADPLGDAGKKAIAEERAKAKEAEKRAKELEARLKEIEDKDKSELEKAQARLAELEKSSTEAAAALLRYQVAGEHKIPADYMDLLTATDRDGLVAQATKVAALVSGSVPPPPPAFVPNPGQGTPPANPGKPDVAAGKALYAERHPKKT